MIVRRITRHSRLPVLKHPKWGRKNTQSTLGILAEAAKNNGDCNVGFERGPNKPRESGRSSWQVCSMRNPRRLRGSVTWFQYLFCDHWDLSLSALFSSLLVVVWGTPPATAGQNLVSLLSGSWASTTPHPRIEHRPALPCL